MHTPKAVVEALLFASPKPLKPAEIVTALRLAAEYHEDPAQAPVELSEQEAGSILQELAADYSTASRSFQLVEQVSGWTIATRPEYQVWVRQLFPDLRPARLSVPALETLAIIAYRQPVTKPDIEAIRGVSVDAVMPRLLDAGLVKIAGRADVPGRPLLYETTHYFMEHFGLKSLDELPNSTELRHAKTGAANPDQPPAIDLVRTADSASSPATEEVAGLVPPAYDAVARDAL